MELRRATVDDAEEIYRIRNRSWRVVYSGIISDRVLNVLPTRPNDSFLHGLKDEVTDRDTFVSFEDGHLTGFITVGPWREHGDDGMELRPDLGGEIWAIYADPDHWRTGVGKLLLQAGMEWLHEHDYQPIRLWVVDKNEVGKAFYRKNGFAFDGGESELRLRGQIYYQHRFTYQGS
ncbi:GNAT family N-acetyltransferase [Haloglycomyces albus]|uniref:GNAT family N-acetyltransferase n=1 Tax=Haloglycomyces albus TaxID=526067 RepID=UPI00046D42AE|nr:GNAT family N-acetyltransferase [Haloglycomyces albus]